ncbi:MAG: toxin glutamine deamidase domain-containing protein, partial [Clostridium sp.]|nr:toxin glutamine deamidase domain-containing protein [Clostridium sp.]
VNDVPVAFKDWVRENADRIENAQKRGAAPYFVADNEEYIQGILNPSERDSDANNGAFTQDPKKTIKELAEERHAARTQEDIDRIQSTWNERLYSNLEDFAARLGWPYDDERRNLLDILFDEMELSDFDAFKLDYKIAKNYVKDKIAEQTALARRFMQNPSNAANMREFAKILGVEQGELMTFFEANQMMGNPNYSVSEAYRINCQTCVVAHELRRRGFDVEALANTKGSLLERLSKNTSEIWMDADGNIPLKACIGAKATTRTNRFTLQSWNEWEKTVSNRKQLVKELESSITEDGRYHIDWFWNTQSTRTLNGHIITLEKIGNTLRYYDPQNGKVIDNFYDYIADIKLNRGIRLLRVDNLRVNPEYASQILDKSGSKTIGGAAGKSDIGGIRNPLTDEQRLKRDKVKEKMISLKHREYTSKLFKSSLSLPNKSIREWVNQPHYDFDAKNDILLNLQQTLDRCDEKIRIPVKPRHAESVSDAFALPINIGGKQSYIIIHEMRWGETKIYGISDNDSIFQK